MNWGYKILFVLIAFVLGIFTLIYIASKQTNEMLDQNYYEKELNYQQVIDGKNNLRSLGTVNTQVKGDSVLITFPTEAINGSVSGKIEFLKMDDQSKDKIIPITTQSSNPIMLLKSQFDKGKYSIRIDWLNNQSNYFYESTIFIE